MLFDFLSRTISYLTAVDVYAIGSIFSLCLLNICKCLVVLVTQ